MQAKDATEATLQTARSTVRRRANRGRYERVPVFAIIDEALHCHVAFVSEGAPVVLPMIHARVDGALYLHGALSNAMLKAVLAGGQLSVAFTLVDGLVFARSAFHHSMNYRSVVLFGAASEVTELDQKRMAAAALVERVAPGRIPETRAASDDELRATRMIRIPIEEASAKVRSGPPIDDAADLDNGVWAGELPLRVAAGPLRRDPLLAPDTALSGAVAKRARALAPPHLGPHEWRRGEQLVSTDRSRIDLALVHQFLSEHSYWAQGLARSTLERAMEHSFCFGLYEAGKQLGFARVVSDLSRFAYLADVFILEAARGRGLGTWLVECALAHPELRETRRWLLGTRDAHALYGRFGFQTDTRGRFMERAGG